jgi:hypothetical protein
MDLNLLDFRTKFMRPKVFFCGEILQLGELFSENENKI